VCSEVRATRTGASHAGVDPAVAPRSGRAARGAPKLSTRSSTMEGRSPGADATWATPVAVGTNTLGAEGRAAQRHAGGAPARWGSAHTLRLPSVWATTQ
jgi:hypothetical protein